MLFAQIFLMEMLMGRRGRLLLLLLLLLTLSILSICAISIVRTAIKHHFAGRLIIDLCGIAIDDFYRFAGFVHRLR